MHYAGNKRTLSLTFLRLVRAKLKDRDSFFEQRRGRDFHVDVRPLTLQKYNTNTQRHPQYLSTCCPAIARIISLWRRISKATRSNRFTGQ